MTLRLNTYMYGKCVRRLTPQTVRCNSFSFNVSQTGNPNGSMAEKEHLFEFFSTVLIEMVENRLVLDQAGRELFLDLKNKGVLKPTTLLEILDQEPNQSSTSSEFLTHVTNHYHFSLEIACTPGYWVVSSIEFKTQTHVACLFGEILQEEDGFEKYKQVAYEFDIGSHINNIQNKILPSNNNYNCKLYVQDKIGFPVPFIVATTVIPEKTKLILCQDTIRNMNEEYKAFRNSKITADRRVSSRIRNRNKEEMNNIYKMHLIIGTEEGLERVHIDDTIGYGVIATKIFKQGDFICEYRGELISKEEGERRYREYPPEAGSFMFQLESKANDYQWVDATYTESISRYINHSRINPNSKSQSQRIDGKPKIFLVAAKDIFKGEQVFYNYGDKNRNFPFLQKS